ncbi:MAG: hypothetical protein WCI89_00115 [bacterium]
MTLSWSFRRKLLYAGVSGCIVLLLLLFVWVKFFTAAPTCFDGKKNGGESGVDCGGSCTLVCSSEARAPVVLWARAFPNGQGIYTAAAYIQNNNIGKIARNVSYTFQLFDARNILVVEKNGVTDLPPMQTIPIVEPNISVGNRTVAHTLLTFSDVPVWESVLPDQIPSFHTSNENFTPDGSSLTATVQNVSSLDESGVAAVAVLFDKDGVARAASKSLIPNLLHKTSAQVYFTWPQGNQDITQAEITLLPAF